LDKVLGKKHSLSALTDSETFFAFRKELALLPSPRIYGGTGNIILDEPITYESLNEILGKTRGMRLIGQRFVPDSYIFQQLVSPKVAGYMGDSKERPFTAANDGMGGFYRAYVRGLDVMAILGSSEAFNILTDEGDTNYQHYKEQFNGLKDEFDALNLTDWNRNLYWSWLYTLKGLLQEVPEGYPEFMRTQAWRKHHLCSALASWTQLRHDTILQAKLGGATAPPAARLPVPPPGYVEPVPVFWGRLLSLTRMTSKGLDDFKVLTPENRQRFNQLENLLQQIIGIVTKQLTNKPLLSEEKDLFKKLPYILESILLDEQMQSSGTALVADIHSDSTEKQVVEEAVGSIDDIIVACPMSGDKAFLAIGPILSYYEFKYPMNKRFTDEAWRELLMSPSRPERPKWYSTLMQQDK
jgi:hypothetical protein